ncbi:hypothetical protein O3M35_003976 [Rhynocoris fuscipes]|uniref:Uncharacterized protein n=1 Tax=Rhynocoris fuscipes TaxID=488301 RepID=A0AAW1CHY0_9HEMI
MITRAKLNPIATVFGNKVLLSTKTCHVSFGELVAKGMCLNGGGSFGKSMVDDNSRLN